VLLFGRGDRAKELEILVLRHELSILRWQTSRPKFETHDRLLAAMSYSSPTTRSLQQLLLTGACSTSRLNRPEQQHSLPFWDRNDSATAASA
jgi:hypothetical protein